MKPTKCSHCGEGYYNKKGVCPVCGEVFTPIKQKETDVLVERAVENLSLTYCRLQPSPCCGGVGVFAVRDIPKGINPFEGASVETWVLVPYARLKGIHKNIIKMAEDFGVKEGRNLWLPLSGMNGLNISYHLNHSKTPNMEAEEGGDYFLTLRAIKAGEELLVDYDTYENEVDHNYK